MCVRYSYSQYHQPHCVDLKIIYDTFPQGGNLEKSMQITLTEVSATENVLEGFDLTGTKIRVRGTTALPYFKDGKITDGPTYLEDQPCEAVIDDTEAVLTITPTVFQFTGWEVFVNT